MQTCTLRESVAFLRDPAAFMTGAGLERGDFYRVRAPALRLHVITDPRLAEGILVGHASCFAKGALYWRELQRTMGDSMGSLEGDRWEYLHGLQSPSFTPGAVRALMPAAATLIDREFRALEERIVAEPEAAVLDVFSVLNVRIILATLFGREPEPGALDIAHRIGEAHDMIARRTRTPWLPRFARLSPVARRMREHERFFSHYADALRAAPVPADRPLLVHVLSAAISDRTVLRNELMFHLGASTETQSSAEGWMLYLLSQHSDVLRRLRDETAAVTGGSALTADHIPALVYAKQVVQESLRAYPPVYAIIRDCVQPAAFLDHEFRRGETFLISVNGLHRNPRLWRRPAEFDPDRFRADRAGEIVKYQYLPFGGGPHVCIGQHMAVPLMTLAIAEFARRFDWSFVDRDIHPVARPSLKPSGAFRARLTRRC